MPNSFYHKELTEAQWDRIKYLFKEPKKVGRPTLNPRMVLKGILCILRTGARWRDLPARYGNWNNIYHKFRQWCASGLFQLLLQSLTTDAAHSALLEIDSTFCKVHQSACSGLKNQAIVSSRGGKNIKIYVIINERMQLLGVVLTGG
ncbi:MAG: IS5 family transposase [Selenomonadaceae bacterium]|nr:IS5 family transposase [Selenomonadaceae bacterium]